MTSYGRPRPQQRGQLTGARRQHRERQLRAERRLLRPAHDLHVERVNDQPPHLHRSVHAGLAGEPDVVAEAEALRQLQLRRIARREVDRAAQHRDAAGRAPRVAAAFVRVRDARRERALEQRAARARIDRDVAARFADEGRVGGLRRLAHDRRVAGRHRHDQVAPRVQRVGGQLAHDVVQRHVLWHGAARAERSDDVAHLLGRPEPPRRVFLQRAHHHLGDRSRNRWGDEVQRIGIALHHGVEHRVDCVAFECAAAGEELVEDRAEGEEVGARIDAAAAHLLRRHVVRRAEDRAGAGHARLADAGQSEVDDLHLPASQICSITSSFERRSAKVFSRISRFRSLPSSSSIAMKKRPESSPKSWTTTMFGWPSRAADCASRRKRRRFSSSPASMIFSAT